MEDIISKIFAKKIGIFWGVFAASVAVFSVWLYAFYPANLSIDSINQIEQIYSGSISNAHPYVFTLFLGIFVKYLGGVATFAFFQILISALIAALFATYYEKKGVNRYVLAATLGLFWLSPAVGIYNVTIWKDVLFAQLVVLLGYAYLRLLDEDSVPWQTYIFLGLSVLIALTRHNGAIYLVLAPALLFCVKKINLKMATIYIVSAVLIYMAIIGPVASIARVSNNSVANVGSALRLQLVASILSSKEANLSESDTVYYEGIMSRHDFTNSYHCSSIDTLIVSNKAHIDQYFLGNTKHQVEFVSRTNALFIKNVPLVMADRVCLFAYQLGLGMQGWYDPYYVGITSNDIGYVSRVGSITPLFTDFMAWSIHLPQRAILWNHFLTALLYLAAFVYGLTRKSTRICGYVTILCINLPVLAIIGVSNDYRYLYLLTLGVFFLPGVIISDKPANLLKKKRR